MTEHLANKKLGEEVTIELVLEAIRAGERVPHAIARYIADDANPDPVIMQRINEKLDKMVTIGLVYQTPQGLYREY